jgi:hypothetical protein
MVNYLKTGLFVKNIDLSAFHEKLKDYEFQEVFIDIVEPVQ